MPPNDFRSPGPWLFAWGGLGAALVLYVIFAASVQTFGARPQAAHLDQSLLVGEMAELVPALPSRPAPDAAFERDGTEVTLADFRGKVVLVNFWATWCGPCLKELPSLDRLEFALGGPDFEVVAVAADTRGAQFAGAFLDRLGVRRLKRFADPRLQLMSAIGGANVLPVSILIDRRGHEVGRLVGDADWSSDEAQALIRSLIDQG